MKHCGAISYILSTGCLTGAPLKVLKEDINTNKVTKLGTLSIPRLVPPTQYLQTFRGVSLCC